MGAEIVVHDPYVKNWWELGKQDIYPGDGKSWARYFLNQDKLNDTRVCKSLAEAVKGVDAVVLAVRHQEYRGLSPERVVQMIGRPAAVIDCFGILDDAKIQRYFELGCEVKGPWPGPCQEN